MFPFIDAGSGFFPLGQELFKRLAEEYQYPLPDSQDLAKVTEFIAVATKDGIAPKDY